MNRFSSLPRCVAIILLATGLATAFRAAHAAEPASLPLQNTEQLCRHIGQKLTLSDGKSLQEYFLFDEFLKTMNAGLVVPVPADSPLAKSLNNSLSGKLWIFSAAIKDTRWYVGRFTRDDKEGDRCTLVTIPDADHGLIASDIYLRMVNGKPVMFDYLLHSVSVRGTRIIGDLLRMDPAIDSFHSGYALSTRRAMQRLQAARMDGNGEKIEKAWLAMTPEDRALPLAIFFYIDGSNSAGENFRGRAAANVLETTWEKQRFPMLMVEDAYARKNLADLHLAIDALEKVIGHNPSMSLMRIAAYEDFSKPLDADFFKSADHLLTEDDGLENAYWLLLVSLVSNGYHADSVLVLDVLEQRFNRFLARKHFTDLAGGKAFIASSEYKIWLADYKKRH